jgi:hypothetical protein
MGHSSQPNLTITFPAIAFNGGWLSVFDSMRSLSQSSRHGFKKAVYNDSTFVDSTGTRFQVAGARKVRTVVGGVGDLIGLLTGNAKLEVEFTFASQGQMPLTEVKRLISESFNQHPDYWEEMVDFEEFRSKIEKATSLDGVFSAFKEFHLL